MHTYLYRDEKIYIGWHNNHSFKNIVENKNSLLSKIQVYSFCIYWKKTPRNETESTVEKFKKIITMTKRYGG